MITRVPKNILASICTCDDCGRDAGYSCDGCHKDLCWPCVTYTGDINDSHARYCKSCWEIIQKYKPLIAQLHNQIDSLEKECETKCKEKRKADAVE